MHALLQRQVVTLLGPEAAADPALKPFLQAIDAAYRQADLDRAALDRSLSLTSDELLQRNAELRRDLDQMRRLELDLRQADKRRVVGQLAGGIAHELNTPIQYIGDSVRFIEEAFEALSALAPLWHQHREELERIPSCSRASLAALDERVEEADLGYYMNALKPAFERTRVGLSRMTHVMSALRGFANEHPTEKVLSDVNHCLLDALAVTSPLLREISEVELTLGSIPAIPCDPGQLKQAFLHLLTNAAQAVAARTRPHDSKGTIHIRTSVEARGHSARERSSVEDRCVVVAIADDGGGITPEHRDRVFEPFFSTRPGGVGAGLSLAQVIVEETHGGALTFSSELGRGTTFYVRLPLA